MSAFYNLHCARAITAFGRKACKTVVSLLESGIVPYCDRILCANTDSVSFTFKQSELKNYNTEVKRQKAWERLNETLRSQLGSLYELKYEHKKFALVALYPAQSRHVVRFLCD